jgi:hypothetical protein
MLADLCTPHYQWRTARYLSEQALVTLIGDAADDFSRVFAHDRVGRASFLVSVGTLPRCAPS